MNEDVVGGGGVLRDETSVAWPYFRVQVKQRIQTLLRYVQLK